MKTGNILASDGITSLLLTKPNIHPERIGDFAPGFLPAGYSGGAPLAATTNHITCGRYDLQYDVEIPLGGVISLANVALGNQGENGHLEAYGTLLATFKCDIRQGARFNLAFDASSASNNGAVIQAVLYGVGGAVVDRVTLFNREGGWVDSTADMQYSGFGIGPSQQFVPVTANWAFSGYDQPIIGCMLYGAFITGSTGGSQPITINNMALTVSSQNASKEAGQIYPTTIIGYSGMTFVSPQPAAQITLSGASIFEVIPNPTFQTDIDITAPDNSHESEYYRHVFGMADLLEIPRLCSYSGYLKWLRDDVPALVHMQACVHNPTSAAAKAAVKAAAARPKAGFLDFLSKVAPIASEIVLPGSGMLTHALINQPRSAAKSAAKSAASASAAAAANTAASARSASAARAALDKQIRAAAMDVYLKQISNRKEPAKWMKPQTLDNALVIERGARRGPGRKNDKQPAKDPQ